MNNGKIPSIIRWTRSDYAKLSYAVRQFNKKISELEGLEIDIIPEEYSYTELKANIYSRAELNRLIKSMKRLSKPSQQRKVELPTGESILQWELSELKKAQKRAEGKITGEIIGIADTKNIIGDVRAYSLHRTKQSIEDLFNRTGEEFKRTAERTANWGRKDYDLWRASIYRENFMNSLEEMSTYKNYDLLIKKLKSIENPIQFYNYIKQSDILSDLFIFYKDKATSQTYGGFKDNQEAFDTAIFQELKINE